MLRWTVGHQIWKRQIQVMRQERSRGFDSRPSWFQDSSKKLAAGYQLNGWIWNTARTPGPAAYCRLSPSHVMTYFWKTNSQLNPPHKTSSWAHFPDHNEQRRSSPRLQLRLDANWIPEHNWHHGIHGAILDRKLPWRDFVISRNPCTRDSAMWDGRFCRKVTADPFCP
jgi:hypothetical protein